MDNQDIISYAKKIAEYPVDISAEAMQTEAAEFLRLYAGERSTFYTKLANRGVFSGPEGRRAYVIDTLRAFIRFVEGGHLGGVSITRSAQIDVVSDLLEQANTLLETPDVHPAFPTAVIGAALEEFLRNWVEEEDLPLGGKKPCLDSYAKILREAGLITKQDVKDITAWAGLRNHAAHGDWTEVSDRKRIRTLLEGVNLFMRKYGPAVK